MRCDQTPKALLLLFLLVASMVAQAADPQKPHPHQGIVPPFEGAPPRVTLSEEEESRLARGEAVLTTLEGESGGRGTAVRDVKATRCCIASPYQYAMQHYSSRGQ